MNIMMKDIVDGVIMKGASSTLFGGSSKKRYTLNTLDFIYECMIGVALELTEKLPIMFEHERQKYEQQKKLLYEYGNKGKYTDSYGWSKSGENKMEFSFDLIFFHYFNRIIVPFLGGRKKAWNDENSKIWKWIKKLIISGDKDKIFKLQRNIRNRILKEAKKKIQVGANGTDNKGTGESKIIQSSSI